MVLLKKQDKQDFLCMKTKQLDWVEVVQKRKKTVHPDVVNDYNNFMGVVDRVDQMLSEYLQEKE